MQKLFRPRNRCNFTVCVLALVSLLILVVLAPAASAQQSGDFTYSEEGGMVTITRYTGGGGAVVIPAVIDSKPVVSIGESAFQNCADLTSVIIPSGVTSIGNLAFAHCFGLTSVSIPNSVTSIGDFAFFFSALTSVILPDSVISIGTSAFGQCDGLTSINMPNSVTSVGAYAFSNCSGLTSVTIPDSVTSIGGLAFEQCSGLISVSIPASVASIGTLAFGFCSSLTSIIVDEGNANYSSLSGALYNKDQTKLIEYPAGKSGGFIIPDGVTVIGTSSFYGCTELTIVTIPDSVTEIEDAAFASCNDLDKAIFVGDAPVMGSGVFVENQPDFSVLYTPESEGFTETWYGYPAEEIVTPDNPPEVTSGPYVADGSWPWAVLPMSPDNPLVLDQNVSVLWTFTDDYTFCSGVCSHMAEYQVLGESTWTPLAVSTDPSGKSYAYVDLPIEQFQNGTYAFRYSVTDCAGQTTQSETYYFKVDRAGPAAGIFKRTPLGGWGVASAVYRSC